MGEAAVALLEAAWRPSSGTFSFGPVTARAETGRLIALIGPNGAGKSSLLNLAAGLLAPLSGRIEIFGKGHDSWNPRERGRAAAFLPQDAERPFGFPVDEFVGLGRFPHTGPFRGLGDEDRSVVAGELEAWGLSRLAKRSVRSLSGGEFQRARLARSLAQEPRLLILDEPGNHLDMTSRRDILERLAREARAGRCVLAVLHDVNDALLFADEAWLMGGGRLLEIGPPSVVLVPEKLEGLYGLELEAFTNAGGERMLGFARRSGG